MINKLLEKLKQFFYERKNRKRLLPKENVIEENKKDTIREFKEKLNIEKEQKLLHMQHKYEEGNIAKEKLTSLEIVDLISLYKKQIKELDIRIESQELKLNKIAK